MVCCRIESAIHCSLLLHELQAKKKNTPLSCVLMYHVSLSFARAFFASLKASM